MFWRSPPRPMSLSSGPSSPCSRVSTVSRCVPCSSYPGVSSLSLASYSAEPVLLRLPPRGRGQPRRPGEPDRRPDRAPARRKGPRFPGPCWQSEGTDPQGKVKRNSCCLHILFILTLKLAMMIYPCTTPTEMRRNLPLTF